MAKRISQLNELMILDGSEDIPVVKDGQNFRIKTSLVQSSVTKASIGLSEVDNTSDANKPISNATQSALNTKAATVHTHTAGDITGLTQALAEKANTVHGHALTDISGLQTALDGKANALHAHDASNISGLGELLLAKSDVGHTHTRDQISGLNANLADLQSQINFKANSVHGHNISEISGLGLVLDSKANVIHTHVDLDVEMPGLQVYVQQAIAANGGALATVIYDRNEW